ncbi:MAG TPA: Gfo/Idh/MocA family oxidoreductase [Pirellulales bacterium]|nr:Gfo/Idh/MocA family oxidoreductase [Pirellulales bacterium]
MNSTNRRDFLKHTGLTAAAVTMAARCAKLTCAESKDTSANERPVVAVIGTGGMGMAHVRQLAANRGVRLAYVCDVDERRSHDAAKTAEAAGAAPAVEKDLRRVLDDKSVDAVWIATPDHWHAPATILACQAGKHVYVEKPCSHNLREGRLMIEAARRNQRVVQVGTQSRSTDHVRQAIERLRSGAIGDVLVAKAWNSQRRSTIGHAQPSEPPPQQLDYDLWLGPAPFVPYQANLLPGIWRWWHAFGTGDMGNDGVHDIDIARWGLGVETHPGRIAALGGKSFFDDDQQFPDTQYVVFEYGAAAAGRAKQLIFEQRIWSPYVQEGHENGNAFYGTEGVLILGKQSGWQLFGPKNKLVEEGRGSPDLPAHHRDFLDCIRAGGAPHAEIEINHLSSSLCHLGNIATRVGRVLRFDPATEQVLDDDDAQRLLRRDYRDAHWAAPRGA